MPIKKTYYEILGVSRIATQEQIKRRYRMLVRKYHPDVADDKEAAQSAFIEIKEAYETISNPNKRTIYDAGIDAELFRVPPPRSSQTTASRGTDYGRDVRGPQTGSQRSVADKLLHEAQSAFIQGDYNRAASLCKEAKRINPRSVKAHMMLGDIYGARQRVDEAIAMYTMAAQFDPDNAEIRAKLKRLMRCKVSDGDERYAAFRMGTTLVDVSIMAFLFILVAMNPGKPISWLRMYLPFVGDWSAMLIGALIANGVLTGVLLRVNGIFGSLDDELIPSVQSHGARAQSTPVLLLMLVLNFLSFYLAAGIYFVIALVQQNISKSVAASLAATFMMVFIAFLVYPMNSDKVLLWGGNIVFPSVLLGWAIGGIFKPGW